MPNPAAEYSVINVGGLWEPQGVAAEYSLANVGLFSPLATLAVEYLEINLNSNTPTPTIFGTDPIRTRTAETVDVVGTGFGQPKTEFNGILQGQDDTGTWQEIPTLSWSRISASADAYNANRVIDTSMAAINVEHDRVEIVVPPWATPPHLPLRIVTDGP